MSVPPDAGPTSSGNRRDETGSDPPGGTDIRAFLIADVRGYTAFTQAKGDEEAARLAGRFAAVARAAVDEHRGQVLELRGDEALCVFGSPRFALRAAIELQRRFLDETRSDPSLPLTVGVGLDAGEAVQVEGGYRGGALNVAARLCSMARAGEVLASKELVHLARRMEGVVFAVRGKVELKGLDQPVEIVEVRGEDRDIVAAMAHFLPSRPSRPKSSRRRMGVAAAGAIAVAGLVTFLAVRDRAGGFSSGPDTVIVIDPATNEIVDGFDMGGGARPGPIAFDDRAVWVANASTKTIARIDPETGTLQPALSPGGTPTGIATGFGKVWVALGFDDQISIVDPNLYQIEGSIPVPGADHVAVGFGSIWVTSNIEDAVYRIDPQDLEKVRIPLPRDSYPLGIAAGPDSIWVADSLQTFVSRIDPETNSVVDERISMSPDHPNEVAVSGDPVVVWVTSTEGNTLSRIDPRTGDVNQTIPVGAGPVGVAGSDDSVWVANFRAGNVWRLDARSGRPIEKIAVAGSPWGIIIVGDRVWVTVQ